MTTGATPAQRGSRSDALSEVIGFILALALIISAMSVWMVYVVPSSGRDAEIAQMESVRTWFTDYKLSLDGLRSVQMIDNLSPVMTSTSINLGTGGGNTEAEGLFLQMLKPASSPATIQVKETGDTFAIDSSNYHGTEPAEKGEFPINLTSLEYRSSNNYFIQQNYYYQLGGVFLSQSDGATNRVLPLLSVMKTANDSVVVTVVPVRVVGGGSIGGTGPVRVDTRFRTLPPYNISQGKFQANRYINISVTSQNSTTIGVWQAVFQEIALSEELDLSSYTISNSTPNPASTVFFNITGGNPSPTLNDVTLHVQRAEFYVAFNNIGSGL